MNKYFCNPNPPITAAQYAKAYTASPNHPRVLRKAAKDFTQADILRLHRREVLAVHLEGVLTPEQCKGISRELVDKAAAHGAVKGLQISYGLPWFLGAKSEEAAKKYFAEAKELPAKLRQAAAPYPSPLERMQGLLIQGWPAGAGVMVLDDRGPMCPALARIYREKLVTCAPPAIEYFGVLPHIDSLKQEAPGYPVVAGMEDQLAKNLYVGMPVGGELVIWDFTLTPAEYDALRLSDEGYEYAVDPRKLGLPTVVIRPEPGDAILFPPELVHAVLGPRGPGRRVTWSCFLAMFGLYQPLKTWG